MSGRESSGGSSRVRRTRLICGPLGEVSLVRYCRFGNWYSRSVISSIPRLWNWRSSGWVSSWSSLDDTMISFATSMSVSASSKSISFLICAFVSKVGGRWRPKTWGIKVKYRLLNASMASPYDSPCFSCAKVGVVMSSEISFKAKNPLFNVLSLSFPNGSLWAS